MIGDPHSNFAKDYSRIHYWWERNNELRELHSTKAIYAYAQPYRNPFTPNHIIPQWQKDLAGWVNKKAHFVAHSFGEFEPRKGFTCQHYIDTLM